MIGFFLKNDERGVVTVDWVALTAGIVALGIVVVYLVMNDSADNLLDQFDLLNDHYVANAVVVSDLANNITIGK